MKEEQTVRPLGHSHFTPSVLPGHATFPQFYSAGFFLIVYQIPVFWNNLKFFYNHHGRLTHSRRAIEAMDGAGAMDKMDKVEAMGGVGAMDKKG